MLLHRTTITRRIAHDGDGAVMMMPESLIAFVDEVK
jgi:hypothetical protein